MNLLRGGRSSEADIADIMSAAVSWDVYQLTRELSTKPLPLGALVAHRLAQSEVLQHRILAASSAATLDDTDLDALSGDPSYWVRTALAAAAGHVERVMRLLAEDPQFSVRQNVASNRNAPADLIADMAITGDFVIRRISVNNPALPMDVLRRLTGDFVGEVANTARKALARRERAEAREAQP